MSAPWNGVLYPDLVGPAQVKNPAAMPQDGLFSEVDR